MRTAINAAIIENKKILVVKKRQTWILPGGKPGLHESDLECLSREISEELPGAELYGLEYYKEFEGKTPYRGDMLKAKVYFAKIVGEYSPSAEIVELDWVNSKAKYNFSDITSKIINSLKNEGYII